MTQKCRLCLQDNSTLTSISELLEGLPVSVIMMIICPVTIRTEDKLPKFICEECLEVVVSAHKLRTVSSKNELFLKSISDDQQPETIISNRKLLHELSPEPKQPISIVKTENFSHDEESIEDSNFSEIEKTMKIIRKSSAMPTDSAVIDSGNVQMQYSTKSPKRRYICKHIKGDKKVKNATVSNEPSLYPFILTVGKNVRVACGKSYDRSSKMSFVWNYFGKLVDVTGNIFEETAGWNYCRLCLESKDRVEKRFNASCSTTALHRHLRNRHGLSEKADEVIRPIKRKVKKMKLIKKEGTGDLSTAIELPKAIKKEGTGDLRTVIEITEASTSSSIVQQINEPAPDSHQKI